MKYLCDLVYVQMKNGNEFLLTDTVGFIQKLPTTLVSPSQLRDEPSMISKFPCFIYILHIIMFLLSSLLNSLVRSWNGV